MKIRWLKGAYAGSLPGTGDTERAESRHCQEIVRWKEKGSSGGPLDRPPAD